MRAGEGAVFWRDEAPTRAHGTCHHWRDLAAMSVAQRLAVETVQAYSGVWRTLEEAITRSSKREVRSALHYRLDQSCSWLVHFAAAGRVWTKLACDWLGS
jgi:hypothetical protein